MPGSPDRAVCVALPRACAPTPTIPHALYIQYIGTGRVRNEMKIVALTGKGAGGKKGAKKKRTTKTFYLSIYLSIYLSNVEINQYVWVPHRRHLGRVQVGTDLQSSGSSMVECFGRRLRHVCSRQCHSRRHFLRYIIEAIDALIYVPVWILTRKSTLASPHHGRIERGRVASWPRPTGARDRKIRPLIARPRRRF